LKPGEGYVSVEGGRIWYRIIGEGSKSPLLLVHGGPGGTCWGLYPLAPISKDRPLIYFDQLGSGNSDILYDTTLMTVEHFVEQMHQLKTALKLNHFYLYGHSWGTTLAMEYYLVWPEGVRALIFNSPMFSEPAWSSDADTLIGLLPDSIQWAIDTAEMKGDYDSPAYQQAVEVYYRHYLLRTSRVITQYDTVPENGNDSIYRYMWGPSEFTATGTLKNYDITSRLEEIAVPTLFIAGEFDEARPSTVRYFQSLVAHSDFEVIKNAGHATMHDNAPRNIQVIRDFLDELEAR
jgi:proline iminopeptidase